MFEATPTRKLTDYLKQKYDENVSDQPPDDSGALAAFLEWVDKFFTENTPLSVSYVATGFVLNMPDRSQVSFSTAQLSEPYQMHDGAVRVIGSSGGFTTR